MRRKDSRSKLQKESPSKKFTIDPSSGENLLNDDLDMTDRKALVTLQGEAVSIKLQDKMLSKKQLAKNMVSDHRPGSTTAAQTSHAQNTAYSGFP
mgnify:CR=1 FL=1